MADGNLSGGGGLTSPVGVADGGTGNTSIDAYEPVIGGTTATGALQSVNLGTSGQVLTSNGAGAAPTFQDASGGGSGLGQLPTAPNTVLFPVAHGISGYASSAISNHLLYLFPVCVIADVSLTHLGCEVTVAVAGATFRAGLYDNVNGQPTNLLYETSNLSAGATGLIEEAVSGSPTLTKGWYWLALTVFENSGSVSVRSPGIGAAIWAYKNGANLSVSSCFIKSSVDPSSSLPDPLSGLSQAHSSFNGSSYAIVTYI